MCQEAVVKLPGKDDIWCDSAGELAKAFGLQPEALPIVDVGLADWRPGANSCLCHIDFKLLAANFGMRAACTASAEWVISPPKPARKRAVAGKGK